MASFKQVCCLSLLSAAIRVHHVAAVGVGAAYYQRADFWEQDDDEHTAANDPLRRLQEAQQAQQGYYEQHRRPRQSRGSRSTAMVRYSPPPAEGSRRNSRDDGHRRESRRGDSRRSRKQYYSPPPSPRERSPEQRVRKSDVGLAVLQTTLQTAAAFGQLALNNHMQSKQAQKDRELALKIAAEETKREEERTKQQQIAAEANRRAQETAAQQQNTPVGIPIATPVDDSNLNGSAVYPRI